MLLIIGLVYFKFYFSRRGCPPPLNLFALRARSLRLPVARRMPTLYKWEYHGSKQPTGTQCAYTGDEVSHDIHGQGILNNLEGGDIYMMVGTAEARTMLRSSAGHVAAVTNKASVRPPTRPRRAASNTKSLDSFWGHPSGDQSTSSSSTALALAPGLCAVAMRRRNRCPPGPGGRWSVPPFLLRPPGWQRP